MEFGIRVRVRVRARARVRAGCRVPPRRRGVTQIQPEGEAQWQPVGG